MITQKYNNILLDIVNLIEAHRENAYRKVNEELVTMNYEIGKYLSKKVASEKWGSKVIDNIAKEVNNKYPNLKGFNRAGLYRMMQFYDTYKDNEIVATLLRQISWTNNLIIFSHKVVSIMLGINKRIYMRENLCEQVKYYTSRRIIT